MLARGFVCLFVYLFISPSHCLLFISPSTDDLERKCRPEDGIVLVSPIVKPKLGLERNRAKSFSAKVQGDFFNCPPPPKKKKEVLAGR